MVAIGAVAAAIALVVALGIRWLPNSASQEMDRMEFVYWFATAICIGIFAVVAGALGYIVWAFRAKPGDDTDGPPIHGNSALEVVWTAVPAVLVIAIGVVSAVVLSRNADAGPNPATIKVIGAQFAWYFEYPAANDARSNELVLPVDRGVRLELTSRDVIHSFWIPEMGQKQDLVPGMPTKIVVTPTRTGSFTLVCTELCGLGHAAMRAPVRVVSQAEYAAFVAKLKQTAAPASPSTPTTTTGGGAAAGVDGAKVFAASGCGSCHTFTPAGATMQVGPNLDNVAADAKKAGVPVEEFVRQSIVDPGAVVAAGYQNGVMPTTFGKDLSSQEIDALVQYLTTGKGTS